ncbi:hypothetical protein KJ966_02110 [bacterium]|nr:hypothetical protein [bacterium]
MNLRLKVLITIFLVSLCPALVAGPTIIRDERITDLALTPTLGRGYTIVTNTFQSKCLDNIVITDPSFDFQYKFESLDVTKASQLATAAKYGLEVSLQAATGGAAPPTPETTTNVERKHHIYVEINMDTYYASVDEAQTSMSSSAAQLLTNNDIPGFFSSCGSYYVRSLGRNAKFVSIFTYTTKTDARDSAFESDLKSSIMKFGEGGGEDSGGSSNLLSLSGEYKLTIVSRAYGLGIRENAELISSDIDSFKAAIKEAFQSMQNPMTGKVTTMEIVPWVENTDFQNLIQLEEAVIDPVTQRTMLLYKKKQVLNENAEYLAEIERADRNMMNIYYKSMICKQTVQANWMKEGKVHPDFKDAEIANNKFPRDKIKLETLVTEHLSDAKVAALLDAEEKFMYGSGGGNECINEMLKSGMFIKSYRDIDVCKNLRGKLSAVGNNVIDNYCMPKLVTEFVIEAADQPSQEANKAPANP